MRRGVPEGEGPRQRHRGARVLGPVRGDHEACHPRLSRAPASRRTAPHLDDAVRVGALAVVPQRVEVAHAEQHDVLRQKVGMAIGLQGVVHQLEEHRLPQREGVVPQRLRPEELRAVQVVQGVLAPVLPNAVGGFKDATEGEGSEGTEQREGAIEQQKLAERTRGPREAKRAPRCCGCGPAALLLQTRR